MGLPVMPILAAICGTTISVGIISIAVGLNRLNTQVALLNSQFARVEKDIADLSKKVAKLYEEHLRCSCCGHTGGGPKE